MSRDRADGAALVDGPEAAAELERWDSGMAEADSPEAMGEALRHAVRVTASLGRLERARPGRGGLKPSGQRRAYARMRERLEEYAARDGDDAGAGGPLPAWMSDLVLSRSAMLTLRTSSPLAEPFRPWWSTVKAVLASLGSVPGAASEVVPVAVEVLNGVLDASERWRTGVRLDERQREEQLAKDTMYGCVVSGAPALAEELLDLAVARLDSSLDEALMGAHKTYRGAFPCSRCARDYQRHSRGTCYASTLRDLGEGAMRAGLTVRGLGLQRRALGVLLRPDSIGASDEHALEFALELGSLAVRAGHRDEAREVHREVTRALASGSSSAAAAAAAAEAEAAAAGGASPEEERARSEAARAAAARTAREEAERARQTDPRRAREKRQKEERRARKAASAFEASLERVRRGAPVSTWRGGEGGGGGGGGGAGGDESRAEETLVQRRWRRTRTSKAADRRAIRQVERQLRSLRAAAPVQGPPPPVSAEERRGGGSGSGSGSGSEDDSAPAASTPAQPGGVEAASESECVVS